MGPTPCVPSSPPTPWWLWPVQEQKRLLALGITGPEAHVLSRPEEVSTHGPQDHVPAAPQTFSLLVTLTFTWDGRGGPWGLWESAQIRKSGPRLRPRPTGVPSWVPEGFPCLPCPGSHVA